MLPQVLLVQVRVRVLEALPRTLVQLLVLERLVLLLLAEVLARVLMLVWGRTFVLCWVLAQLMLLVMQVQVLVQALV